MAMTLRLSDAGETRLQHLTDSLGKSKTQIIEDALTQYDAATEHRARVQAAFAHVEDRHAAALARLADR